MPDTRITGLAALTGANVAANDPLVIVDVSDTSMAATGTNKRINASELATGLSPYHKTLRQLIHLAEEGGPFEGFASGAYQETLPSANPFPTSIIWWTSSAKTHKIVEETITYNSNKTINTDEWKVYDTDGSTVLATVTDTVAYSGVFETSRTRTIA